MRNTPLCVATAPCPLRVLHGLSPGSAPAPSAEIEVQLVPSLDSHTSLKQVASVILKPPSTSILSFSTTTAMPSRKPHGWPPAFTVHVTPSTDDQMPAELVTPPSIHMRLLNTTAPCCSVAAQV